MSKKASQCALQAALIGLLSVGCSAPAVSSEDVGAANEADVAGPVGLDSAELFYAVNLLTRGNKCVSMPDGRPAEVVDCKGAGQPLSLAMAGDGTTISRFGGTDALAPTTLGDVRLRPVSVAAPLKWTFTRHNQPGTNLTAFEISYRTLQGDRICLDTVRLGPAGMTRLQAVPCNGSNSQLWFVRADGTIQYRLRTSAGLCLTESTIPAPGRGGALHGRPGFLVTQEACDTSDSQRWAIRSYPELNAGRDILEIQGSHFVLSSDPQAPPNVLKTVLDSAPYTFWALDAKQGAAGFTLVTQSYSISMAPQCFDTPGHTSAAGSSIERSDCVAPGAGMRFTLEAVP